MFCKILERHTPIKNNNFNYVFDFVTFHTVHTHIPILSMRKLC